MPLDIRSGNACEIAKWDDWILTHCRHTVSKAVAADFYDRDPRRVSRDLLGKVLVRREAETSCRAHRGSRSLSGRRRSRRSFPPAARPATSSCSARPGFLTFISSMAIITLNVSCLPDGEAGGCAVSRARAHFAGSSRWRKHETSSIDSTMRPAEIDQRARAAGRAFGITRERDNGKDLTSPSPISLLADDGFRFVGS